MSENKDNVVDELDMEDQDVVVITDDEGNEFYYVEEEVFAVGEDKYAILVPLQDCEHEDCECDAKEDEDEDEAIIAKIVIDEDGEEVYCDPTEEEFEKAQEAYEKLWEEQE